MPPKIRSKRPEAGIAAFCWAESLNSGFQGDSGALLRRVIPLAAIAGRGPTPACRRLQPSQRTPLPRYPTTFGPRGRNRRAGRERGCIKKAELDFQIWRLRREEKCSPDESRPIRDRRLPGAGPSLAGRCRRTCFSSQLTLNWGGTLPRSSVRRLPRPVSSGAIESDSRPSSGNPLPASPWPSPADAAG
jgi:hypothetical protein